MSKVKTYAIILLLCNLAGQVLFAKDKILYGIDIKAQASNFFYSKGIDAEVLISDKRAFYACPVGLAFAPKNQGDWRTIQVSCNGEKWKLVLRTNANFSQITKQDQKSISKNNAIALTKNMSKGEVIEKSDLELVPIQNTNTLAVFTNFGDLIGRKVKANLSRGTILKSRHIKYLYNVNKNETVVVIVGNKKISVVTYGIAMAAGQIGDTITVKNVNSNNTFKAIVLDEKKVTPLTNM